MGKAGLARRGLRSTLVVAAGALVLTACGDGGDGPANGLAGTPGGTLTVLAQAGEFTHLDPQRNYSGQDIAFANAYLHRTLTAYRVHPGPESGDLVADLATDLGTPNDDFTAWSFTIRDGVRWEDGPEVTCEDVKYGVSRTFAKDVITGGPTYAISMLDIPRTEDGSVFKGPYVTEGNDAAAFDEAVTCEGSTITFNLSRPVPDFNYAVTLPAFSPVREDADTGEKYDDRPLSNGPYKIKEYVKGDRFVLERNAEWDADEDSYRPAYPDEIVVRFGLDGQVVDQRLIADATDDQGAVTQDPLQPGSLATVFGDDRFADRRINDFDPSVRYVAINTERVPNLKHRQAIQAAFPRETIRTIAGGEFTGDLADGVITPNMGHDFAPSGLWDTLLGRAVPADGDAEFAKQLIAESGEPMPDLVYDYNISPNNEKGAAAIIEALGKAGIKVTPNPVNPPEYYGIVLNPQTQGHMSIAAWGSDWLNASTVIPELFSGSGGFNMSRSDDAGFNDKVGAALVETDRVKQGQMWAELNQEAMAAGWAVPLRFGREQRLAGSAVGSGSGEDGRVYLWSAFGTWPFHDLFVRQ